MDRETIRLHWLKREDEVALSLRQLYEQFGYVKYRMRAFEEYALYLDNKSFLGDRSVVTFNDLSGRVLALKPDVTLSIVKNTRATEASSEKLYYLENTYRLDRRSHDLREVGQLGLECIGRLDLYQICEVLKLAALTLARIDDTGVLALSHSGFMLRLMDELAIPADARPALTECVRLKNAHQLRAEAARRGVSPGAAERLCAAAALFGPAGDALARAHDLAASPGMAEALSDLAASCALLDAAGCGDRLMLDFSLMNDIDYYSGIVFQGYVQGVPRPVLSGGYYGALLKKFGRDLDAIGFAVYLNELSHLYPPPPGPDADALVRYRGGDDMVALMAAADRLRGRGLRVRVERDAPDGARFGRVYRLAGTALEEVDGDA
ncbi:MAG: hypothetical protein GX558_01310 [Clostridiales bacterium]|nr:hypothetical protein [Clostridiales bacterium]